MSNMSQITDYRPKGEDEKPVLVDVRGCLTGRKLSGKGFITGDCEQQICVLHLLCVRR